MKKLLYYWGIPIAVFCLFVCAGLWIKNLSLWTIFEYYGNIHHPKHFNSETTGQIGDAIGGTTAPFIALMAGFLTFIAFWAQLRANNQVREQFRIQQFESQYFEMIRLHKENINEMKISGYSYLMATSVVKGDAKATETITRTQIERVVDGRKVFVAMVKELNACFNFCVSYAVKFNVPYQDVYEIAYRLFFFGSFSSLPGYDQHKDYIQHCKTELKAIREEHKETFGGKKDFTIDGKQLICT
ncbi:Integral membrane sensor signal transduction histidine kinase [Pedobacter cryoconitis]|uniref:Integral membrane sensor signal transduction histidine kinase n=1 Tax=Pedobacter cryoconitis TaxID=188932 RepID=A0A127VBK4_9SPHI|nr:hypothetical protein [Pedobacter cryoconitis]AMP98684.1 Integral membrane sensor signal transduction histidine kinase [Pedobacter cryoconitis]